MSDISDSESGEEVKPAAKTKIFINNVNGFLQKYLIKALVEQGTYEITGSTNDPSNKPAGVLASVLKDNLEDVIAASKSASVVVFDILDNPDVAKEVIQVMTTFEPEDTKIFVCLSTIMTWGTTPIDNDEPDLSFTEDDFRKRKPHPNFKKHIFLEKLTLRIKNQNIKPFVVCAGLLYGEEENLFHHHFKTAWLGQPKELFYIGEGENIIPTIHVQDLVKIIAHIISSPPDDQYILAVDDSNHSQREIVEAISKNLGTGEVKSLKKEEAYLIEDFSQSDFDI